VDLGMDMLKELVSQAGGRITIMPGSGVRSANLLELARFTGAGAFHSSARVRRPSAMEYNNPAMDENLDSISIDADEVRALRRILDEYAAG